MKQFLILAVAALSLVPFAANAQVAPKSSSATLSQDEPRVMTVEEFDRRYPARTASARSVLASLNESKRQCRIWLNTHARRKVAFSLNTSASVVGIVTAANPAYASMLVTPDLVKLSSASIATRDCHKLLDRSRSKKHMKR